MHDSLLSLKKLISPDRHHLHIAMSYGRRGGLSFVGRVEEAIPIDTIISMFENHMSKNTLGIRMTVLPNKWNLHGILMRERIRKDGSAVRAL
jgi:hypothetical protein